MANRWVGASYSCEPGWLARRHGPWLLGFACQQDCIGICAALPRSLTELALRCPAHPSRPNPPAGTGPQRSGLEGATPRQRAGWRGCAPCSLMSSASCSRQGRRRTRARCPAFLLCAEDDGGLEGVLSHSLRLGQQLFVLRLSVQLLSGREHSNCPAVSRPSHMSMEAPAPLAACRSAWLWMRTACPSPPLRSSALWQPFRWVGGCC